MRHAVLRIGRALSLWVLGIVGVGGCGRKAPAPIAAPIPTVLVSTPIEREVTDFADFTGRTVAVESVEVRARVWGYLEKIHFQEGALVKAGEILFEIDPRIYEANLKQAEGNLASLVARVTRLDADLARAKKLVESRAIAREEFDKISGERAEAAASVEAARAAVERARLDLSFTKVVAPISGRVSRALVTVGNLVQSGEQAGGTLLTNLVSVDPIHVYFDVDEGTVLRVRALIRQGKATSAREARLPISLGLANDKDRPYRGVIDFVDNQIDPRTGTLRVRGVFDNKEEILTPGLFVRVRVPIGRSYRALLVNERAIDTDQGQRVLYLVNNQDEVSVRPIEIGARHDGLRVVSAGLQAGERVVVNGIQLVRPGMKVQPKAIAMPTGRVEAPPATEADRPAATKAAIAKEAKAVATKDTVPAAPPTKAATPTSSAP